MTDSTTTREDRWPGLFEVPSGVPVTVAAAVTRRLLHQVTDRLGVRVVDASRAAGGGTPADQVTADEPTLVLHRPEEFYARVGRQALIGFGEGYLTGAWDSPDLELLLTTMAQEMGTLVPAPLQRLRRLWVARHPRHHRNHARNTRRNIAHHYDLSNDLFRGFLDPTLSYSSALFAGGDEGAGLVDRGTGQTVAGRAGDPGRRTWPELEEAQIHKIERLLDRVGVGDGTRLLEIGSGWGELAIRAAQRGATVVTLTLSSEQQTLARKRIAEAGLTDRISVELRDYRSERGTYDAVVSVEMIEAVGHEFLPAYFATIDRVLALGGRAGIQAISMGHERMQASLGTYTWINKYIFPGGFIPSLRLVDEVLAEHTSLHVAERFDFGLHYAETLRLWRERFDALDTRLLGFDEVFDRMWRFYLGYSRAGFASGYLDVSQLVLARR